MPNYFEWFGLPVSYAIDAALLKQRFLEKSRELHPDHHPGLSEADLNALLGQASLNNQAYKALLDAYTRLQHILQLYDLLDEVGGTPRQLPGTFLMDMMELNEVLEELGIVYDAQQHAATARTIEGQLSANDARLSQYFECFVETPEATRRVLLEPVLGLYLERKYLLRLAAGLRSFATQKYK
jgi:molecular chaperone HscB